MLNLSRIIETDYAINIAPELLRGFFFYLMIRVSLTFQTYASLFDQYFALGH